MITDVRQLVTAERWAAIAIGILAVAGISWVMKQLIWGLVSLGAASYFVWVIVADIVVVTPSQSAALLRLFDEIPSLFHRLRALAEDVHGREAPSAGRRGILRSLDRLGPRTVPQLARARQVSRQHIQILAKGLMEAGQITEEENPAHRKSPLLGLAAKGKRQLQAMQQREIELLTNAPLALPAKEIDHVTEALSLVRGFLDKQGTK